MFGRSPLRLYASVVLLLLFLTSLARAAAPAVYYAEPREDLRVKVLGGAIVIQRTFANGQWYPNYNWAPLKLTFDTFDNSVRAIARGKVNYPKTASGVFTYQKRDTIQQTPTGFRWMNRDGDWIEFDSTGDIQRYGDRNDITVSFQYETVASGKRIIGVFDHFDRQMLWYDYTGNLLTAIRDYTGRQVQYHYTGTQLTSVTDVNGYTWQYGYTGDVPTTFTDPENRPITRTWASNGELASLRYADGVGMDYIYEYDSSKSIYYVQERTTGGRITETWMDRNGETFRRDLNGRTIQERNIDTAARTRTDTDARGLQTIQEYDQWDNLTKSTYPDDTIVSIIYDPIYSNPLQRIDERSTVTKYEYDTKGNLTKLTEAVGSPEQRITDYIYDNYGQLLSETRRGDAETQEAITSFTYDNQGNLKTVTDAEGHTTEYSYDIMGNPLTLKDPLAQIWSRSYDAAGHLTSQANPLGHTVRYDYDKVGNRIKLTDARNHATDYTYDSRDNLTSQTDPLTNTWQWVYDADNQLVALTDPRGHTAHYTYDKENRLTHVTDALGNQVGIDYGDASSAYAGLVNGIDFPTYRRTYAYNKRGRLTQMIDHLDADTQSVTQISYDARGKVSQITDAEERITTYHYDAHDRPIEAIDPLNQSTKYQYDNRDNLIQVTDPNNHSTEYTYDKNDRRIQETRPGGQHYTFTYNAAGRLIQTLDPDGRRTVYTQDIAGRLIQTEYYGQQSDETPERTVTYTLDANGNLEAYSSSTLSASYDYDKNNRLLQETTDYGPFSLTHHYSYNKSGNRASYTGPNETTPITYGWNAVDQFQSLSLPNEGSVIVNEYHATQPKKITFPGGMTQEYQYDNFLRLTQLTSKDPASNVLLDYHYHYDKTDNILNKETEHGDYAYQYDNLQRLTQAKNPTETEGWVYDPNGNRTSDALNPGAWTYDDNDRLLTSPQGDFTYDNAGNQQDKNRQTSDVTTRKYLYNAERRLKQVSDKDDNAIVSYEYDPFGRRIQKTVGIQTTYFHYTQDGLAGEYDASGNMIQIYGFLPKRLWTTDPLYTKTSQDYAYYHNDHLGTPQQLSQKSGAVVWKAKYSAFGEAVIETETVTQALRFAGQYDDQESNLYYNYHRYYKPEMGRYLTSDPIGLVGGINTYVYAGSTPIVYFDDEGLVLVVPLIGAIIGGYCGAIIGKGRPCAIIVGVISGALSGGAGLVVGAVLDAEYCSPDDSDICDKAKKVAQNTAEGIVSGAVGSYTSFNDDLSRNYWKDAANRRPEGSARKRLFEKLSQGAARRGAAAGGIGSCITSIGIRIGKALAE